MMANSKRKPGVIAILTGGGDVPGLNPAIRAVTYRALREGYKVIGLRRGWAGVMEIIRDEQADNSDNFQILTEETVNRPGARAAPSCTPHAPAPAASRRATSRRT
jgi:6-phosphofructokinase 1